MFFSTPELFREHLNPLPHIAQALGIGREAQRQ